MPPLGGNYKMHRVPIDLISFGADGQMKKNSIVPLPYFGGSGDKNKAHISLPVDKNRSTTGGQSGPSYLQLWPQQEDSPDHANWAGNLKIEKK